MPGIGTPMTMPMRVRINRIHAATFKVQVKLLLQGAFSRNTKTTSATTATHETVKMLLLKRISAITNPIAQIHHVSGCSCSRFNSHYLFKDAGVGISTPHSFAGNPFNPQIKPEPAARIFAT